MKLRSQEDEKKLQASASFNMEKTRTRQTESWSPSLWRVIIQKMVSSWFSFLVKTGKNKEAEIASGRLGLELKKWVLVLRAVRYWNEHQEIL